MESHRPAARVTKYISFGNKHSAGECKRIHGLHLVGTAKTQNHAGNCTNGNQHWASSLPLTCNRKQSVLGTAEQLHGLVYAILK